MATLRTAVIKKCREQDHDDRPASEQRWCLYTHDGKKLLGRHPSKESALKQERAIQVHKHGEAAPSVVKYKGAYYHSVQALQEDIDPSARIFRSDYYVSAKIQLTNMDIWLQRAEKIFDALVAAPEMEKYDDKRQAIDDNITKARKALKAVESLTNRRGDKLEKQSETIKRFQKALEELQSQRAASVQRVNEKMARQEKSPEMVKYAGHFYVLAEDEAPEEEKEEKEEEEEVEEETEEMDLLDALKGYWQTILDKLPDDLEVDEDFEAALTGIDDVIAVMEKIHEEYEEPEGEEGSEEESEGE
jgi:predicted  nucleic acid-binding Zn-ribbon protein